MKTNQKKYQSGEKVIFIPENKVYDFGYYGATGKVIIYNEGERNMQDSSAVDPELIESVIERDGRRNYIAQYRGLDYPAITVCYVCHDGNGNYLMNKRSTQCNDEHGTWDFGGGRVELGDSIERTVKKELYEEYGVRPITMEFLGYHDLFRYKTRKGKTHWLCMIFLVEVNRDLVVNNEPHKFEELQWFRLDHLPTPLHPLVSVEVNILKARGL